MCPCVLKFVTVGLLTVGFTTSESHASIVSFVVPGSESTTANPGYPDVSGSNVIWRARQGTGWGIYGRNLSTNTSYTVTTNTTVYNDISIAGNIVTWDDTRNSAYSIYARNLTGGGEFAVSLGTTSYSKLQPRTDGQRIVWTDSRSGSAQVYSYNVQTGSESFVANAPNTYPAATVPDVSGDNVVYHDNFAVYIQNTQTSTTTRIGGNEALRTNPSITGNYVVYERRPNSSTYGDIYAYNITTGEEIPVATGIASQQNPKVSDRYVVWEDGRDNASGIYGFDLVTRQEFLIAANGSSSVSNPSIDGNLVVWSEQFFDGRPNDIRAAYVPEPTTVGLVATGLALLGRRRRA